MKFRTKIKQAGKTATGIEVPEDVVTKLGAGKRPLVSVTINKYTYRSAIAVVDSKFMVGVSADVRAAAGVAGGDTVDVDIVLDTAPREVSVPADLKKLLANEPKAKKFFESLSNSKKKLFTLPIEDAKTPETRQRRLDKAMEAFRAGRI